MAMVAVAMPGGPVEAVERAYESSRALSASLVAALEELRDKLEPGDARRFRVEKVLAAAMGRTRAVEICGWCALSSAGRAERMMFVDQLGDSGACTACHRSIAAAGEERLLNDACLAPSLRIALRKAEVLKPNALAAAYA